LDEIAGWVVLTKCKTAGVTSKMEIKYLKPVYVNRGDVEVRSRLANMKGNMAHIISELYDGESTCCAKAELEYFCYPEVL